MRQRVTDRSGKPAARRYDECGLAAKSRSPLHPWLLQGEAGARPNGLDRLIDVQHTDHPISGTIHDTQEQRPDRKSGEIEHIALGIEPIEHAQLLAK